MIAEIKMTIDHQDLLENKLASGIILTSKFQEGITISSGLVGY